MERQLQKPRNAIGICRWRLGCVIVRRCTVLSCQNILAEYPLHHILSTCGRFLVCFIFDPASKHSPKKKHTKRLTQVDERWFIQWLVRGRGGWRGPLPCGNQSRVACEIGREITDYYLFASGERDRRERREKAAKHCHCNAPVLTPDRVLAPLLMYSSIVGKLLPGIWGWLGGQQTIGRNGWIMMMLWRWQWRRELFHPRWRGPEPSGVEGRRDSKMVVNALFYCSIEGVQRYPSLRAPNLVNFVPAIARLFCLALPGFFLTMFCAE